MFKSNTPPSFILTFGFMQGELNELRTMFQGEGYVFQPIEVFEQITLSQLNGECVSNEKQSLAVSNIPTAFHQEEQARQEQQDSPSTKTSSRLNVTSTLDTAKVFASYSLCFLINKNTDHVNTLEGCAVSRKIVNMLPSAVVGGKGKLSSLKNKFLVHELSSQFDKEELSVFFENLHFRKTTLDNHYAKSKELSLVYDLFLEKDKSLNFILSTTKALNAAKNTQELFDTIVFAFEEVFDLQSLHIAFWNKKSERFHYYLGIKEQYDSLCKDWEKKIDEIMLESLAPIYKKYSSGHSKTDTSSLIPHLVREGFCSHDLELMGTHNKVSSTPSKGTFLTLPLKIGNEYFGGIVIQLSDDKSNLVSYGKDMSKVFDSVCQHIAQIYAAILCDDKNEFITPHFVNHIQKQEQASLAKLMTLNTFVH